MTPEQLTTDRLYVLRDGRLYWLDRIMPATKRVKCTRLTARQSTSRSAAEFAEAVVCRVSCRVASLLLGEIDGE